MIICAAYSKCIQSMPSPFFKKDIYTAEEAGQLTLWNSKHPSMWVSVLGIGPIMIMMTLGINLPMCSCRGLAVSSSEQDGCMETASPTITFSSLLRIKLSFPSYKAPAMAADKNQSFVMRVCRLRTLLSQDLSMQSNGFWNALFRESGASRLTVASVPVKTFLAVSEPVHSSDLFYLILKDLGKMQPIKRKWDQGRERKIKMCSHSGCN